MIKHDFYSINWVYVRSQRILLQFDSIRFLNDIDRVALTRGVDFMCGCIYGLVQVSHGLSWFCTVSHDLSRSCTITKTIIHGHGTHVSFLKVLKIIHSFHGYT